MSRARSRSRWVLVAMVPAAVFLTAAWASLTVVGQDTDDEKAAKTKVEPRLPTYYGKLKLNDEQRATVLEIQADYGSRIADLEAQIETLRSERDEKCREVLNADQKEALEKLEARGSSSLAGRVMFGNAAVARATIKVSGPRVATARSDEEGRFSFEDLPAGSYEVTASGTAKNERREASPFSVEVEAPPAENAELTIELE